MPLDRAKTVQNAEKFMKAGKLPEAITEYKKLADDNPRDMNVFNKLGDLCVRAGKNQDAIRYFLRIAEFYASDGFFLKAIAMYKKVSKLDPSNMDCLQKLASLYLKQGLTIEAKAQYLEVADHFIKAAQFKKAVDVFPAVLEMEPDNIKVRMTYADLLVRTGAAQEAAKQYVQVGRDLAGKGMVDEATRVGQKGLKVAPGNPDLMSLMLSLSKDARKSPDDLLAAVVEMAKGKGDNPRSLALLGEAYLTAGKAREAEQVFRKLSGMGDGAPPEVAAAVGRYHISKDDDGPALEWVARAAGGFVQESRGAEASALFEEFLRAFPDHRGGLAKRADIAAQAGDTKGQVAALHRLAQILIAASEIAPATEIVQRLREIDPDSPRYQEMLKSLQARSGGASPKPAPGAGGQGIPVAESAEEIEVEHGGLTLQEEPLLEIESAGDAGSADLQGDEDAAGDEEPEYGPESKIQEIQAEDEGEEPEDDEFISEHFTEAEVFIKYGLLEKAKQQLLGILAKHPRHVPSHTKLKEIYYEEGNKEKAVEECVTLAELFKARGRGEEARELMNEAIRIDPNNPRVKGLGSPAAPPPATASKPGPAAAKAPAAPPRAPAAPPKAAKAPPPPPRPAAAKPSAPAAPRELEIEEAEGEALEIETAEASTSSDTGIEIELPEEEAPAPEPPKPAPPSPRGPAIKGGAAKGSAPAGRAAPVPARPVPEKVEEETPEDLAGGLSFADAGGEITIEIEDEATPSPTALAPASSVIGRRAASAARDPDSEKLGEVDFYIDQGLLEEARAVLFQLQKQYPESQEVARRFERANRPAREAPAPAAAEPAGLDLDVERAFGSPTMAMPPRAVQAAPRGQKATPVFRVETAQPESEGDFFDLASELDRSLAEAQVAVDTHEQDSAEGPGHSLDEIFKAFKKGVEQQVDSHDYETHYNLGIAYKEMGLVDEAIGEFQFAAKDPARTVECCGILGLCFREKGMPDLALKWYRKGLDSPDLGEREAAGLRYDIAEIHRDQGDYHKALQLYTEVYGMDSTYRDVAAKVKEMRKLLG